MLTKILIGLVVVIVILLIVIATRPDSFRVERSIVVNAPADSVFPHLNDFRKWMAWSPWEKLDPDMERTYGMPSAGAGATYAWNGKKAGAGNMTITESTPAQRIDIRLEFTKPMKSVNTTVFEFTPAKGGTRVTWTMTGDHNFMSKAMCLVVSMDKLVGGDFEKGLSNLKAVAERN